jgi:phosphatidylglycerol:prolipoprotein diacylglycerol transferase
LIGGIIGARLWHILTPPPSSGITAGWYFTHPLDALAIWKGGLGIPGAVMGGLIALYFYTRKHKLNFAEWTDISAPSVALGQAIGRWGNFVNQELYGAPTNLPWKLYIEPQHRLAGYQDVSYYHPLFLYESLWNLGNMFLLLWTIFTGLFAARRLTSCRDQHQPDCYGCCGCAGDLGIALEASPRFLYC